MDKKIVEESLIFVDLDGSLVDCDTLEILFKVFVKQNFPLNIFHNIKFLFELIFSFFQGRPKLKEFLARNCDFNPETLPYNSEVLSYLSKCHDAGKKLVLATGADVIVAKKVADYLRIFDSVLASDGVTNLVAENKARAIQKLTKGKKFSYLGNSLSDIPIWKISDSIIAVNVSTIIRRKIKNISKSNNKHVIFFDKNS